MSLAHRKDLSVDKMIVVQHNNHGWLQDMCCIAKASHTQKGFFICAVAMSARGACSISSLKLVAVQQSVRMYKLCSMDAHNQIPVAVAHAVRFLSKRT